MTPHEDIPSQLECMRGIDFIRDNVVKHNNTQDARQQQHGFPFPLLYPCVVTLVLWIAFYVVGGEDMMMKHEIPEEDHERI